MLTATAEWRETDATRYYSNGLVLYSRILAFLMAPNPLLPGGEQ
jgi:hypothetical protein